MEKEKIVSMKCGVCGANCYTNGTSDCDCDAYDYGRIGRYDEFGWDVD